MTNPLLFVLAVLTVLITPGPTNTLLFTSGATVGISRSLRLLVAEFAGYNLGILTAGFVLAPWIAGTPYARQWLVLFAGLYLTGLAAKLWRRGVDVDRTTVIPRHVFVTTLLNPKVLVFAFAIIPLDDPSLTSYLTGFSILLVLVGLGWITLGTIVGRQVPGKYYVLVPKAAAVALVALAAVLVASVLLQ